MRSYILIILTIVIPILSCQTQDTFEDTQINNQDMTTDDNNIDNGMIEVLSASVTGVEVSGSENNYSFSVTIESPDTGCDQYADWWEVFDEEGELIYRRILAHSHVDEQPFTRSGGPVKISNSTPVKVRAHMNNLGYGTVLYSGTIEGGFTEEKQAQDFFIELSKTSPLPGKCAF